MINKIDKRNDMDNNKKLKFGELVNVSSFYVRTNKAWEVVEGGGVGIFLGYRTISNGYSDGDEESIYWVATEYIKVALVAFNSKENPKYIPLDAINKKKGE